MLAVGTKSNMPELVNAKMKSISSAIILYYACILVFSSQINDQCDFSFYSLCASAQCSDAEEQKMAEVVAVLHMDQLGNKPFPSHGPQIEVLVVNGGILLSVGPPVAQTGLQCSEK